MAIRTIEYTVFENGVSPQSEILAGVQNEHLATAVNFIFDNTFKEKLSKLGELNYRFELYDGAGGMHTSVPQKLDLQSTATLNKELKQSETAAGGKLQLYLVISKGEDESELILYSFPAYLALSPLPHGTQATDKVASDLTLLIKEVELQGKIAQMAADGVQGVTKAAEEAAEEAIIAANETRNVKNGILLLAQNGDFNGAKGDKGDKGDNGKDGVDGKDGKDYVLTEADKTEIANIVLDIMPSGDEVSY